MKKGLLFVLAAATLLLSGCHRGTNISVQRNVVTRIEIECEYQGYRFRRQYTSPEKMRLVLFYIRSVRSPFTVEPGEDAHTGSNLRITTVSADETTKTYHQMADRYFQEGRNGWEKIDPEKAAKLWDVILTTPSDPE